MKGVGNDLNNWPNHALKIFARIKILDELTFHTNARFIWEYQGAKDGLESLRQAVQGEPEEAAVEQALQKVDDVGAYDYQFRLDVSLSYLFRKGWDLQVFVQNLAGANGNHRYSYDTGVKVAAPKRVRFVEEPRTVGFRLAYYF